MNTSAAPKILVLGHVTLDITYYLKTTWTRESSGTDLTQLAEPHIQAGGTALMTLSAAARLGIGAAGLAGIGKDVPAAILRPLLDKTSSELSLLTDDTLPTCIVTTIYHNDGTRQMLRPKTHAGHNIKLSSEAVDQIVSDYSSIFISGYLLEDATFDTLASIRAICSAAECNNRQLILDLVPHEYSERVGELELTREMLGGNFPGAIVAEMRTIRELAKDDELSMLQCANWLASQTNSVSVVQAQTSVDVYSQRVIADGSEPSYTRDEPLTPTNRRGLGDFMALRALNEMGYI